MDMEGDVELMQIDADTEPLVLVVGSVFFFQAEDGIRDKLVTGVQTCALPIWRAYDQLFLAVRKMPAHEEAPGRPARRAWRSEERRVGKECRSRWSPDP